MHKRLSDCISRFYLHCIEKIDHLKDGNTDDKKSSSRRSGIYKLDPYMDEKGLLRVGGRLKVKSTPQ